MGSAKPPAEEPVLLELHLTDIYCDGGPRIEDAGPCVRVIFRVVRRTAEGAVHVPLVAVVMPWGSLLVLQRAAAAAVLLAPEDGIGKPVGSG